MHDNLKSLDPDPVAAIGERSRTLAISFDLAPCLNNNSLALPTHHHDTEALSSRSAISACNSDSFCLSHQMVAIGLLPVAASSFRSLAARLPGFVSPGGDCREVYGSKLHISVLLKSDIMIKICNVTCNLIASVS